MKCKGHQKSQTSVAKGNEAADRAAKKAGGYTRQMITITTPQLPTLGIEDIKLMQKEAGVYEQNQWSQKGATQKGGLWRSHDGRLVAPAKLCQGVIKQAHGPSHVNSKRTKEVVSRIWWHPYMKELVNLYHQECPICNSFNLKKTYQCPQGAFPVPDAPFKEICIDYTDMGAENRVKGWIGPFEVIARTSHALQVRGHTKTKWHHLTHFQAAEPPTRSLPQTRQDLINSKE